jgi:hypothetical protein
LMPIPTKEIPMRNTPIRSIVTGEGRQRTRRTRPGKAVDGLPASAASPWSRRPMARREGKAVRRLTE